MSQNNVVPKHSFIFFLILVEPAVEMCSDLTDTTYVEVTGETKRQTRFGGGLLLTK